MVPGTSFGDLCRCGEVASMTCTKCKEPIVDHWTQASKEITERIRVKEQTVKDLLRDNMMPTLC